MDKKEARLEWLARENYEATEDCKEANYKCDFRGGLETDDMCPCQWVMSLTDKNPTLPNFQEEE